MEAPLEASKDCVVCNEVLTSRDLDILFVSNFYQSWCEVCLRKHIESYPNTNDKRDVRFELSRIQNILKNY